MISLPDREALCRACHLPVPRELHVVLALIVSQAAEAGLLDLTHVIIIEPDDAEETIGAELGFMPTTDPIDGLPFSHPAFQPYWAHLDQLGGWYRLIHTVGDSGFAVILLIDARAEGTLVAMCQRFTGTAVL